MAEFEISGNKYKTSKMDAFKQFHIGRRAMPLVSSFGEAFRMFEASKTADMPNGNPLSVLEPVGKALSRLTDEESEYVIKGCLDVCQRYQGSSTGNGIWANVRSTGGNQFEDIGLSEMVQITFFVMQENFSNFLASLPGVSLGTK